MMTMKFKFKDQITGSGGGLPDTTPLSRPTLIMWGASNIYGTATADSANHGTAFGTHQGARVLDRLGLRSYWSAANYGISGTTLATQLAAFQAGTSFNELCNSNTVVMVQLGGNDLAANVSSATVITNLQTLAAAVKATGAKVVAIPMYDRNGGFSGGQTVGGYRTAKAAVNAWLAASGLSHFDGVQSAVAVLCDDGAADSTTYFNSDKIHLNGFGHWTASETLATVISAVKPVVFTSREDGLVSHWPLDGASNSLWRDRKGQINLTANATVGTGTGRDGRVCASFSGAGRLLGTDSDPRHRYWGGTMAGWVKSSNANAYKFVWSVGTGFAGMFSTSSSGNIGMWDGTTGDGVGGTVNVWDNTWHHIAATYHYGFTGGAGPDYIGNTCQMYVDGVATGPAFQCRSDGGYGVIGIGGRGSTGFLFTGDIQDVKLWNRQLTAAEIAAEHAAG